MDQFEWTNGARDAAQMVADGELSYEAIAGAVGTSQPTLRKWRDHPEFQAKVEEIRKDYSDHVRRRGIARLDYRVESLNKRHRLMMQVIEARAADPRMADIPGGTTGLMVISGWSWARKPKGEGPKSLDDEGMDEDAGKLAGLPIVEVDTALLKEIREHEKQASMELGQWTERQHVEHRDLGADEAFDRRMAELAARSEPGGVPGGPDAG